VEIRDLEYFLACCETRNFTAAARQVHIVRSAMSASAAGPPPPGVVLRPLASEALVFVGRPGHPLSAAGRG
jgi:DNA-binding transcriptional LysR family regulator